MVLYKPDCNSNDCKLPSKKATFSILAIEVRLHVGWAINRILLERQLHLAAVGVGRLTVSLKN